VILTVYTKDNVLNFFVGVYFRPEGKNCNKFICGVSPVETQDPDCLKDADIHDVDHKLFENVIWPALYERVPAFAELKVVGSWAGFYEYNVLDQVVQVIYVLEMSVFTELWCRMPSSGTIPISAMSYSVMDFLDTGCSSLQLQGGLSANCWYTTESSRPSI
jgi:hypothetical protein